MRKINYKILLQVTVLFILATLSLTALKYTWERESRESTDYESKILGKINKHFTTIEAELSKENIKKVCSESLISKELIKSNLIALKNIEPKYDWLEIEEVLNRISNELC